MLKYWLGQADKLKGDLAGAEENFRAVTQAQPGNLLAQRELAAMAAAKKDNAQLQQIAETLISHYPNLSDGYLWRAVAEANQNRTDQAETDLQTAIKKNPKDSAALVALGEIRVQQKKYPEGEQLMLQALDANPNQLPALQMLVNYYLYQKQPEKATALVQKEIARSPNSSGLYVEMSGLQLVQKDVNGAMSSADKAMQLNPSDPSTLMAYTRAAAASGNAAAAISKWQAWSTAHPNEAQGDVILGTLEEARGNANGAMDYYKKALAIQPDNAIAQNNLAFLMLEKGQDVDMALSLAESARRSMPHSPNTADTLAWAYYHKGLYGSARSLLEGAEKTSPNDASIQYHLGMVYSKMGDKANATDHLKKAVSLAPGTQTGNDASKALSAL
jgi:tetratricopeptide (TPR) repeat protein